MMTQEQNIDTALEKQGIIEIDYVNQMGKRSILHITNIEKIQNDNISAFCLETQSTLIFKTTRIKNIIVIEQQGIIEIDYVDQMGVHSILHISDIENKKDGNILAYCVESQSDITLRITNIHCLKWVWRFIFDGEAVAQKKGIYVFACRGDKPYQLDEGERLWKYFEGRYAHGSTIWVNDPIAFHYVEPYSIMASEWMQFENKKAIANIYNQTPEKEEHLFKLYAISADSGIEYVIRDRHLVYCNPTLNIELIPKFSNDEDHKNVIAVHNFVEFNEGDHLLYWVALRKQQI